MKLDFNINETKERFWKCVGRISRSFLQLWKVKHIKRKIIISPFCLVGLLFLVSWTSQSNSSALYAFLCLVVFDFLMLIGDLTSQWFTIGGKPSVGFSFGYVRIEILTHFSLLCLGVFLNFWALKIALQLAFFSDNLEIHTGRFIPSVFLGGLIHFFLSFHNNPFVKLFKVGFSYSFLQKNFKGICANLGFSLSSGNLFLLSPFAILGTFAISILVILTIILHPTSSWLDFFGSILITLGIFDAIWPLCVYTGQVLLQTVPPHIVTQLEKALREALTIDGVLEFRNELFWTLTYGQIAGALHVRVRRDANEQLVLSRVYEKLQPLVTHLTIQITKDDFGRNFGSVHILRDMNMKSSVSLGDFSPIGLNNTRDAMFSTGSIESNKLPYSVLNLPTYSDDSVNSVSSPRSATSNSSVFQVEIPHATNEHLAYELNNGRNNAFTMSVNASSTPNSNPPPPNILISSSNFFA